MILRRPVWRPAAGMAAAVRVRERLERHGYEDGGEALWDCTLDLVREHNGLIFWLATHLEREQTLDSRAIDDIVRRW